MLLYGKKKNKVAIKGFLIGVFLFLFLFPFNVWGAEEEGCAQVCPPEAFICFPNPLKVCTLREAIDRVVALMFYFGFMGGFIAMLWGIFLIVWSVRKDDKNKLNKGVDYIKYAALGMVGLLLARPLILAIVRIFGLK